MTREEYGKRMLKLSNDLYDMTTLVDESLGKHEGKVSSKASDTLKASGFLVKELQETVIYIVKENGMTYQQIAELVTNNNR